LLVQKSITTSVRLPRDLKRRIDRKAVSAGRGRNRVIIEALESYLREDGQAEYEAEARRQSQLAVKLDRPDSAWDEMIERDLPGR
jgi:predicted DNA-binding protein